MKNYNLKSVNPNVWEELVKVELSEEQKTFLQNREMRNSIEMKELHQFIADNRKVAVSDESVINVLNAKFDEIKPDGDFIFIGLNLSLENETARGILNYRSGETHKQIRF